MKLAIAFVIARIHSIFSSKPGHDNTRLWEPFSLVDTISNIGSNPVDVILIIPTVELQVERCSNLPFTFFFREIMQQDLLGQKEFVPEVNSLLLALCYQEKVIEKEAMPAYKSCLHI